MEISDFRIKKYARPKCCKNCQYLHNDYDWETGYGGDYCGLNIWLPTRKQTCKKQRPYHKEAEE